MDQETYNGIVKVLQRGAGVMATEYIQAFTAVVSELQERIKAEKKAQEKAQEKATNKKKEG